MVLDPMQKYFLYNKMQFFTVRNLKYRAMQTLKFLDFISTLIFAIKCGSDRMEKNN
jgi:hypothetical protein